MKLGKSERHLWDLQMEIGQSRVYLCQPDIEKTLISFYMIFEVTQVGHSNIEQQRALNQNTNTRINMV